MNYIKIGISALMIIGLMISCDDDNNPNPKGLSEITFSSFSVAASGDGTIVAVTPVSIGATSFEVDFGDPTSTTDVLTIDEQGGSVSYDYPNEEEEATYTITVTAQSDAGLASVTLTEDVTVVHVPEGSITTVPASPTGSISNVFAIYTDGMEYNGELLEYRWGEAGAGGVAVTVGNENVLRFSRLGSDVGTLAVATIDPNSAFGDGIAATHIHFDINSIFSEGIDLLKVTLVNNGATETYEVDGLALTDGEWTGFDLSLSTGFSAAVTAIDEIQFELGTGGAASDHASIYVDNVYLYKETGSTILNGDFEIEGTYATSQWRFTTYTEGESTPFGSSSDGSDFDYDGNDTGDKTRGAKWTSSQSGGPFHTSDSRYAYQALSLTPNTDYVLEYQYAIDGANDDPPGISRHMAGYVLNSHFIDGADALDDLSNSLGSHFGYYAEGKFSDTPNDYGTFVQIPFTSNESGEVAVMFYSVAPADAWIDNVKVLATGDVTAPSADFTSEANSGNYLEYTFTNTSTNGASFVWDFGDGNTSTEKSPTHTYAADGDYDVVLTATNVSGSSMTNEVLNVIDPGIVPATFAAVIQNGDFETYPTAENNSNDLVDAWTIDPDDTFNDATDSPFNWWRNDDLENWVSDRANNGSTATNPSDQYDRDGTDKASSSSTNAQSAGGSAGRSLKFDGTGERAYQPFEVEEGVEYTISAYLKSESTPGTDLEGTFYILHSEPADETDLASFALATVPVTASAVNTWQQISFDFTASSTFSYPQSRVDESLATGGILTSTTQKFVIFYFVPTNTVTTDNEVFITDVEIQTPGF
ncbi:PKD domain-containing protein [Ekhidna sp.]|uniref:PKD domain-containing protein n=1 Tax=Ekhidna sp. TaxID=2608089 RepID=UPI003519154A